MLANIFRKTTLPAFFAGLILGDKSEITPAEKRQFQQAGLMHILSVSGMHLGLIY